MRWRVVPGPRRQGRDAATRARLTAPATSWRGQRIQTLRDHVLRPVLRSCGSRLVCSCAHDGAFNGDQALAQFAYAYLAHLRLPDRVTGWRASGRTQASGRPQGERQRPGCGHDPADTRRMHTGVCTWAYLVLKIVDAMEQRLPFLPPAARAKARTD